MSVTKDKFRVEQKKQCYRTGGRNGVYGCHCCRTVSNLNHFKKHSRNVAKTRFNRSTRDEIREALVEIPIEQAELAAIEYGPGPSGDAQYDLHDFAFDDSPGDYPADDFDYGDDYDDSYDEFSSYAYGDDHRYDY